MRTNEIKRTVEEVVRVEYIAEDGQVFRSEEECKKYEESALFAINKQLRRLETKKYISHNDINDDCSDDERVEGLAKDLTQREMENLLQNQEIASEDFSYELENANQFTDEDLYMLSDGVLALIRNTNEAMKLVSNGKSIEVLGDTLTKYRELNKKICDMLK